MKYLQIFLVLMLVALVGCQGRPETGKPMNNKANNATKVPVLVDELVPRELDEYISLTGKLEGITDIQLTSEVSGKVVEINKKLGDWVNKGEEIARIDNSDYRIMKEQAEASVLSAEAALSGAQMQLEASEKLYEKEIISDLEYAQAVSSFKSAQAGYKGANAGLEQAQKAYDNSRFVAPVSGYIAEMHLEVGQDRKSVV